MAITLDDLRRFAACQSLFAPTTLKRALLRLGFVQADPIRAPARAQDLTLRHRVTNYRVGDLDTRYARLGIEEDFFINYGFITTSLQALMHPRAESTVPADGAQPWPASRRKQAERILVEEAPIVPLLYRRYLMLVKPWLRAPRLGQMGRLRGEVHIIEPH